MALINPYIHFNGNAEEAFTFYKSIFGGEFTKIMRYKDLSSAEYPIAENDADRLMHVALPIGKSSMLTGSDVLGIMGEVTETTTEILYQLVQKVAKKQTNYSMDFQKEEKLKCQLLTALSVHTLECLLINMVFNGW
jgi:uncharacterized glyoxalase superfamily protein PhnB